MRKVLIAVAVLATAAPAGAGGFATVGVTPLPSGETTVWTPTLTVRAHGVTPVDGVQPVIEIWRSGRRAESVEFAATPTGEPGEYSARVEFPGPGLWSFAVADGYSQTHTFKPVRIAPSGAPAGADPPLVPPSMLAGAVGALAGLVLLLALARRRRPSGTPAAAR